MKINKSFSTVLCAVFIAVGFLSSPVAIWATTPTITHVTSITDNGSLLLDAPRSVKVQGNYAYVLSLNDKSLTIFDITTPSSPSKVGEIQDIPNLTGKRFIEVSGNYVYAGGTASGLLVSYDVSNKAAPVLADTLTLTNIFYDFEIQNGYLYAFGDTGTTCFTVVNISDPTNLTESTVASNSDGKCNGNLAGDVSGNYVYTMSTAFSDEYMTIFDISTPTSPTYVSSFSFTNAGFPDSNWQDAEYYDGYLYTTGWQSDVLLSIDVSDPTTPTLADSYVNGSLMDAGVYLERIGSHIIVASYFSKTLLALSIVDPTNLTLTHSLTDTTNLNNPYDFTTNGQYIYVPSLTNDIFSIFTFDGIPPTISLTSLTPDPTSDSTPTFTGSVTDVGNTVASVTFQVDSTSGSWSSCTAEDGAFDEITENFVCTTSVLSDGAHTFYIRSTDSFDNVSGNSSDAFTIDSSASTYQNIQVSKTENSATITYTTDEAISTQMEWGTSTEYGTTTTETDTSPRTTSHTISLSGLETCTTYHFRLLGEDAASNGIPSANQSFRTSECGSTSSSSDSPQIEQLSSGGGGGGVIEAMSESADNMQRVFTVIEPHTMNFNAFLSSTVSSASSLVDPLLTELPSNSPSNTFLVGGVNGLLGVRTPLGIHWQTGDIFQIWYKAYPPLGSDKEAARIIPDLQMKPSIIALSYRDEDLIPPGNPEHPFSAQSLKLAHSLDGRTWTLLPISVVDTVNHTVAARAKLGGYYMIVARSVSTYNSLPIPISDTLGVTEETKITDTPIIKPIGEVRLKSKEVKTQEKTNPPSFFQKIAAFVLGLLK